MHAPRRSNLSVLKEINPEYSLEGLTLKLKLQYFGHLMRRADSLEKTLMLGKFEGRRLKGWQRIRWLDGITDSMDMNLRKLGDSEGQGNLACCSSWYHKEFQSSSVIQSCPTLWDPMDCSMPGFPVHHQLLKLEKSWMQVFPGITKSWMWLNDWTTLDALLSERFGMLDSLGQTEPTLCSHHTFSMNFLLVLSVF